MNTERPILPCSRGHEAPMFSATKRCVACTLEDASTVPWPIMTRKEAVKEGLSKYWTGSVCVNGHIRQRYSASGICTGCNSLNSTKFAKNMRTKLKAARKGMVPLNVTVHKDDAPTIQAVIDNMNKARGLL